MPWKRIALLLVLIAFVAGSLWFIFRRSRSVAPPTAPALIQAGGTLPTAPSGGPGVSTPPGIIIPAAPSTTTPPAGETILFSDYLLYTPGQKGSTLLAFDKSQGAFVNIDNQGNVNPLDAFRFSDVRNVAWSPDRSSAILRQSDGTKTVYNFQTKQRLTLPSSWTEVKFTADNQTVVFKNSSTVNDGRWLATGNLNNGGITLLRPLGDNSNSVIVSPSPDGTVAGLATIPIDGNSQNLYFIDSQGGISTPVQIQGGFVQTQWSADGRWLLFSTADTGNQFKPLLWLGAGEGPNRGNHTQLPLATTASQCAFAKNSTLLVCSVPSGPPQPGYGLSEGAIPNIPHAVMAIDLNSGKLQTIYTPPSPATLTTPVVTADGKTLYITNKTTGLLQSVTLP